jgi:hypothetical protein
VISGRIIDVDCEPRSRFPPDIRATGLPRELAPSIRSDLLELQRLGWPAAARDPDRARSTELSI